METLVQFTNLMVGHLNAVLQCLCSMPALLEAYANPRNDRWTHTKYNKQLKELLKGYTQGFGPYDPLQLTVHTFSDTDPEYNIFRDHDPYDTLKRLCYALIKTQKVRVSASPGETRIPASSTFFGSLISSTIFACGIARSKT